jgi:cytoskeletal protein RodZ
MIDIGTRIKEARIKSKLSLKELSDKTKVRQFVIESIEKGDYSVMPDVYIKSFIKTLCTFLKIDYEDTLAKEKSSKAKKKKFDDEKLETPAPVGLPTVSVDKPYMPEVTTKSESSHFGDLFKKKNINKEKRYMIINNIVYAVLFLAVVTAIYFGFTSLNRSSSRLQNSEITSGSDTVSLEKESNSLFSYFEKTDSLRLTAKAHDTVWIRVLSDGKSLSESLLRPGMEESWVAKEFFIVDLGNVGGANIFRNDEKLPVFGRAGSVVKNIKITETEVLNIYSARNDSIRAAKRKAEADAKILPKMIEQSTIQTSPEFSLPKRDSLKF